MSDIVAITTRLVNRNLQLTLLAGAVALAVLIGAMNLDIADMFSLVDFMKLLVLGGLPIMLLLQRRTPAERVLARGTATLISAVALIHTLWSPAATWPLFLTLLVVVMGQVSLMRYFERGRTHAAE